MSISMSQLKTAIGTNTWRNNQGGTTTVIGNMMITTGFINRISGGAYSGVFGTSPYTFAYPPMMTAMLSYTDYGTTLYPVIYGANLGNSLTSTTGFYLVAASGTGSFQGGGAWNLMYTAIGMI